MALLQISAYVIHWPPYCVCCLAPEETRVPLSYERLTGVRVIHSQVKSWDVPYCRNCLKHVDLLRKASALERSVSRPFATAGFVRVFQVVLSLMFLGGGGLFVVCAGLSQNAGWCFASMLLILSAFASLILFQIWHRKAQESDSSRQLRWEEEKEEVMKEASRLRRKAKHYSCDRGSSYGLAASYEGWYGSVHTFVFENDLDAQTFREWNRGKCLRDSEQTGML